LNVSLVARQHGVAPSLLFPARVSLGIVEGKVVSL